MSELPDPDLQGKAGQPGQGPAVTPEPETYTPERVLEFPAEDAMPPSLRARTAAQPKRKPHRN
jgi:hypothetical protein